MNKKYLIFHGHFYQPPRENPWLDFVEVDDHAYPYHDWNERVFTQCYAPNTNSRILNDSQLIIDLLNNYEYISFNFGPTLVDWLAKYSPEILGKIIEADKTSIAKRGFGNAIAQVYNHVIMPLADEASKKIQISWGIKHFEHYFGRKPAGMWLAETAVDVETLYQLACQGIKFTILAPHQAKRWRFFGEANWRTNIETHRAYRVNLRDGKSIVVFFYNKQITSGLSFGNLLQDAKFLTGEITSQFDRLNAEGALITIATDGETFGHHKTHGDMALAAAIKLLEKRSDIEITNYEAYLAKHPPIAEVEIVESTSWSCAHGIERWRNGCECSAERADYSKDWKAHLTVAMNFLKTRLDKLVKTQSADLLRDFDAAKSDYIYVRLKEYAEQAIRNFLKKHASFNIDEIQNIEHPTIVKIMTLMEIARARELIFTSCAWFFDDVSRIETRQILSYAGYAISLAVSFDSTLESEFLRLLAKAKSNLSAFRDGKVIFQHFIKPLYSCLERAAANLLIKSLFDNNCTTEPFYVYQIVFRDYQKDIDANGNVLVVARVSVQEKRTLTQKEFIAALFGLELFDFRCAILPFSDGKNYEKLKNCLFKNFRSMSYTEVVIKISGLENSRIFSLEDVFLEDRREITEQILADHEEEFNKLYEKAFHENEHLVRFSLRMNVPPPLGFRLAAFSVYNEKAKRELSKITSAQQHLPETARKLARILHEGRSWGARFFQADFEKPLRELLLRRISELADGIELKKLEAINDLLRVSEAVPVKLHKWMLQNRMFKLIRNGDCAWKKFKQNNPENIHKITSSLLKILERLEIDPQILR